MCARGQNAAIFILMKQKVIASKVEVDEKKKAKKSEKKWLPDHIESLNVGRKSVLILLSMFYSINAH